MKLTSKTITDHDIINLRTSTRDESTVACCNRALNVAFMWADHEVARARERCARIINERGNEAPSSVNDRVALWDAINAYAVACGGYPDRNTYGNTARQSAVADVERIIDKMILNTRNGATS